MSHKRIAVATALLGLLATAEPRAQGSLPSIGGALPAPLPLFPASNWWNLDISSVPVDPSSATFVNFVGGAARRLRADMGGSADGDPIKIFGIPYVRVSGSQPKLAVQFDVPEESDGVDHTTETSIPFYPIPSEAITQPHWIEGGEPGNDLAAEGDRHMLIVDMDNKHLYELGNLAWNGTQWVAFSGAFFNMNINGRRPDTWTSSDAAGLAILPGLIRYDEVFGSEPIKHAFRVTVSATPNYFVYPASHRACGACPADAPPMGARFRLKASKDISSYPAYIQRLLQAMKTYGLIVADNGSNMFVTGTYDTRWENVGANGVDPIINEINDAFSNINAADFEVVTRGYRAWDLSAGVTDSPDPVNVGNNITYTATATNLDHAEAPGVVLTDILPGGVTFVSASAGCAQSAGVVTCSIGALAAGATATRTITVTAAAAGTVTNAVSVSYTSSFGSQDSVPSNNTATTTTTVQGAVVSLNDVSVTEGNAGTVAATFTVTLSAPTSQTVTVPYSTADGEASAGSDYAAASGSVVFNPGETAKPLVVTVMGDTAIEENESFFVNLGAPTNATLGDGQGVGTIVDDDPAPSSLPTARDAQVGETREDTISGLATRSYRYQLVGGRSYAAWCWVPRTDGGGNCQLFWRDAGGTIVGSTANTEPVPPGGDNDALIPASNGTYYIEVRNPSGQPAAIRLAVAETTLFSPWFYRAASSGYDGYVEIRNDTATAIAMTVTAFGAAGGVAGTPLTTTLPASAVLLVVVGATPAAGGLGVADDSYGSVQIAHAAMPGAVVANTTTLSAITGLSFDAPFSSRSEP